MRKPVTLRFQPRRNHRRRPAARHPIREAFNESNTVVISNLPPISMFNKRDAFNLFHSFGTISTIFFYKKECFVEFDSVDSAKRAHSGMHQTDYKGHELHVRFTDNITGLFPAKHDSELLSNKDETSSGKDLMEGDVPDAATNIDAAISAPMHPCVVIFHHKCPSFYPEYVSTRIDEQLNVGRCPIRMVPGTEKLENAVFKSAQEFNAPIVVVVEEDNIEYRSVTVYLFAEGVEEHRNMPLEDSLRMIRDHISTLHPLLIAGSENEHISDDPHSQGYTNQEFRMGFERQRNQGHLDYDHFDRTNHSHRLAKDWDNLSESVEKSNDIERCRSPSHSFRRNIGSDGLQRENDYRDFKSIRTERNRYRSPRYDHRDDYHPLRREAGPLDSSGEYKSSYRRSDDQLLTDPYSSNRKDSERSHRTELPRSSLDSERKFNLLTSERHSTGPSRERDRSNQSNNRTVTTDGVDVPHKFCNENSKEKLSPPSEFRGIKDGMPRPTNKRERSRSFTATEDTYLSAGSSNLFKSAKKSSISTMFQVLAEGHNLGNPEYYDDVIDYLKAKREQLYGPKVYRSNYDESHRESSISSKKKQIEQQLDLQEKLRNLFGIQLSPQQQFQNQSIQLHGVSRATLHNAQHQQEEALQSSVLDALSALTNTDQQLNSSITALQQQQEDAKFTPAEAIAAAAAYFAAATAAASQNQNPPSSNLDNNLPVVGEGNAIPSIIGRARYQRTSAPAQCDGQQQFTNNQRFTSPGMVPPARQPGQFALNRPFKPRPS